MASRYQDSEQYEIQFTTRQLALLFGGLVLVVAGVFVGGILIGRGLTPGDAQALLARRSAPPPETTAAAAAPDAGALIRPAGTEEERSRDSLQLPVQPGGDAPRAASTRTRPDADPPVSTSPDRLAAGTLAGPEDAGSPRPTPPSAPTAEPPALPASTPDGQFTIQIGAFREREAAERLLSRLRERGFADPYLEAIPAGIFRVRVGRFATRDDARDVAARLEQQEFQTLVTRR